MKVEPSDFLRKQKLRIRELIRSLSADFEYVSVLGTDTKGTRYQVSKTGASINDSSWSERGFVCRVQNEKSYSEYSFNETDDMPAVERAIRRTVRENTALAQAHTMDVLEYPHPQEKSIKDSWLGDIASHPEETGSERIIATLTKEMNRGLTMEEYLIDIKMIYEFVYVSKIFLSSQKDLEQSYLWSQGYIHPIGQNDKGMKYSYRSFSGQKGTELLDEMRDSMELVVREVGELLEAERLIPGEYEIICDPSMAGLIAHEAFGHGVETDMFVKKRAKAVEYMAKAVASPKVSMHDGALAVENRVSSYLFDDEGTLGTDTLVIDRGILKSGLSDLLSATKLGIPPTGNGKRESFERKAYARMTNTFFSPGEDSLEEMILSVKKGYLLENFLSGMEDPKNWGIQCVALKGREIIDGRLTGKVIAPVYLTGFVPDLLQSISMVNSDLELSGTGACGKGYKEYVKTSTGGPYLKTKGRLA